MNNNDVQARLVKLGPERLAEALLQLAAGNQKAADLVERMTSGPAENLKRFKAKLAGLKRRRKFVDWSAASDFADELNRMLTDLEEAAVDPERGMELVAHFFEADRYVFEQCDDSGGYVAQVFRSTAAELFAHYASGVVDKTKVINRVLRLYENDDYGVRDAPIRAAHRFLPKKDLRRLADALWERSAQEPARARRWLRALESVARQLKDAPLFEKARLTMLPRISGSTYADIARVYLESGDAATALSWLERVEDEASQAYDHDNLLLAVYKKLGQREKAAELAWRTFHECRSADTLATLLSIIGKGERERVIEQETQTILASDKLSHSDLEFLIEVGRTEEAESYTLSHATELNGHYYTTLLPVAEKFEKDGRLLAATAVYRALLESILAGAKSKYYHHGIKYLKKLDALAEKVTDWGNAEPRERYKAKLRQAHSRKTSFWSEYDGVY